MGLFPATQPPFCMDNDNDNQNIMSSSNSTYFQEDSLMDIENSWNANIHPLLRSQPSSHGAQAVYHYQQQQRLQSYIDAPPQRALFTTPSLNHQQYAQGVRSLPQTSLSHAQRNPSPTPSQDFTSSTSTSGQSPDVEPDLSFYSPQQSHLHNDDFLHQTYAQQNLWSDNGSGNGYANTQINCHVNLSQVQSFADTLYEPGTDEVFIEMHNHLSTIKGEAHYPSEIHTHSNNYSEEHEHSHSQGQEDGTYQRYPTDEGLGTSIHSAPSPADSTTAYDRAIEEEEDSDEYTPKTRSARKRAAPAHYAPHQPVSKRSRPSFSTPKSKSKKSSANANGTLTCTTCPLHPSFNTPAALAKHVATAHTRPYTCVFAFAGCVSTFASKNEWKRHVSSQHLCLSAWVCMLGQCGKAGGGSEFNRKDLFTQHCRRMHAPSSSSSTSIAGTGAKGKGKDTKWEEELKDLQKKCIVVKRDAPRLLRCPVRRCDGVFEGKLAWDERMEHVGKHLDSVAGDADADEEVQQGGVGDELLVDWAVREGIVVRLAGPRGGFGFTRDRVAGGRGGNGHGISIASVRDRSVDVDAEGELEEGY